MNEVEKSVPESTFEGVVEKRMEAAAPATSKLLDCTPVKPRRDAATPL